MRELSENTKTCRLASIVACLIFFTTFFSILAIYYPFSFTLTRIHQAIFLRHHRDDGYCDLFKGNWVQDPTGPLYTNATCSTIPTSKDCFLHGRNDKEFLYWKWKPHGCELPGFKPETFFNLLHGKRLAFIGDSVARNQIDSLLCLLSQQETPIDVYKDAKDRSRTWFFPRNNVTIMVLWTRFLIKGVEKQGGVFDLRLDNVDDTWARNVTQGVVDIAIVSDAQWFFKKNYLYEDGKLIGCLYCNEANVSQVNVEVAIGKALQTTLRYLNDCKECKEMVTLVRTISPSHFENGTWNTGGNCERTNPYNQKEVRDLLSRGKNNDEWLVREAQIKEVERARKEGRFTTKAKIEVMDITRVMVMRADGHPSLHWRDKKKGFHDCVHWCMPGPIDVWNQLMLSLLKRVLACK